MTIDMIKEVDLTYEKIEYNIMFNFYSTYGMCR